MSAMPDLWTASANQVVFVDGRLQGFIQDNSRPCHLRDCATCNGFEIYSADGESLGTYPSVDAAMDALVMAIALAPVPQRSGT